MNLLELYLTPLGPSAFRVIVSQASPPIGDASGDAELPFWEGETDWRTTMIKTLESIRFNDSFFPSEQEQDWMVGAGILAEGRTHYDPAYLEHIGNALYQSLFPDGSVTSEALRTALRFAEQEEVDLHLRLKFSADSPQRTRLADYPWELMHDGQRFLQHRQVKISRYIAYEALPPQLPSGEKLRVLLVSSRTTDMAQGLGALPDDERWALETGLKRAKEAGLIRLEQLSIPTRKGLSRYLTDCDRLPQVIHFDGHGLYGKQCRNSRCKQIHRGIKVTTCRKCGQGLPEAQGFLMFEGEKGKADYVSAREFAALLPKGISVVVLSACQSGMAVAGESVFNGTAQQLIDARVPAVVAMQYEVMVQEASEFSEQFYRVLGKRRSLLDAVTEGRKWMGVDGDQWYRPVLYLRWQDNEGGLLFSDSSPDNPPPDDSSQLLMDTSIAVLENVSLSVQQRLQLIKRLNQLPASQFEEVVVALNPPGGVVPSSSTSQGMRTSALLQWAEGPTGRGLAEVQGLVGSMVSNESPRTDSRRRFYERQRSQLEEELAAVEANLATALTDLEQLRLTRKAEQLLKQLGELDSRLT